MPISESELIAYTERVLSKYDQPSISHREETARIREYISRGLTRLNSIAESDSFWAGTNRKPTIAKLGEYFRSVLAVDPEDDEARWVLIVLEWDSSTNGFGGELLEVLVERDVWQVRWLVAGAKWVWEQAGCDTTGRLRASLVRLRGLVVNFDEVLAQLVADPDRGVSCAAKLALEVLAGGTIRKDQ